MDKKNILLVVGSFRKNSFNQSLADYIAETLKNEANVEFLNYKNLPILEQDAEYPTPEQVINVRNQVRSSDALWVVSPEYNGSYPALLKNLFDWLSRPEKPFDSETPTVIAGKPVTVSAAAGSTEGKFVRENLSTLFSYIRMNPMPGNGTGITLPMEVWQTGVLTLTDKHKEIIDRQVKDFLEFISK